ncbi:iron-sulfur-binding ferredoxin reductase [Stutzerimonas zhaodongensis]|jgi:NAD(P)H-flavin reductase/ferredoxin|uniref:Iron-sulfur-binding ferredoxin reductase n=1 Tax=Stutzerimonas zhaodongensis TaxID=1176257 RepID=A0A365PSI2_9GAMM|nr:iron-sulfur-binding ferredoxin reductase [Stutzerimonas zhaodongensis]QWV16907.1 iron-sulfur-binding ferredoxin reductase [Stutzerimonas zhaodongensis]RBA55757.1 iron-sulfur-binding ferredoxin reductase [Stutzerimonas zhaodongensis]
MPEITHGGRTWRVANGSNLLDALNDAGLNVPFSCRAGSCHACLVRCLQGEPQDARPQALDSARRSEGWRLACQCSVTGNLDVATFDPAREGLPARVEGFDWLDDRVLRLRLIPERPLRYYPGQHALLWNNHGVARPYSLASVPWDEHWLEFHLDCRHSGAFCNSARTLIVGDSLRLGQLHTGALRYEPEWHMRPLLLLAAGTGLAPLWSLVREALQQGHQGPIRLLHFCRGGSYLREPLENLAELNGNLSVECVDWEQAGSRLQSLQATSRQEIALICGGRAFVEDCAKRMFLAGLPRGQILSDAFLTRQSGV